MIKIFIDFLKSLKDLQNSDLREYEKYQIDAHYDFSTIKYIKQRINYIDKVLDVLKQNTNEFLFEFDIKRFEFGKNKDIYYTCKELIEELQYHLIEINEIDNIPGLEESLRDYYDYCIEGKKYNIKNKRQKTVEYPFYDKGVYPPNDTDPFDDVDFYGFICPCIENIVSENIHTSTQSFIEKYIECRDILQEEYHKAKKAIFAFCLQKAYEIQQEIKIQYNRYNEIIETYKKQIKPLKSIDDEDYNYEEQQEISKENIKIVNEIEHYRRKMKYLIEMYDPYNELFD